MIYAHPNPLRDDAVYEAQPQRRPFVAAGLPGDPLGLGVWVAREETESTEVPQRRAFVPIPSTDTIIFARRGMPGEAVPVERVQRLAFVPPGSALPPPADTIIFARRGMPGEAVPVERVQRLAFVPISSTAVAFSELRVLVRPLTTTIVVVVR